MRFNVMFRRGQNVLDPETGETIGDADIVKARVKVIEVKEKLSIARTFRTYLVSPMNLVFDPFGRKEVTEKLSVEDDLENAANVVIGDPVVQVIESGEGANDS